MAGRPVTSYSAVRQVQRAIYAERRARGVCVWCGRKASGALFRRHQAKSKLWQREQAAKRQGRCRECGSESGGFSRCQRCADKRRRRPSRHPEYRREHERRSRRSVDA